MWVKLVIIYTVTQFTNTNSAFLLMLSRDTTNGLIREFIYLLTPNWLINYAPCLCVPHLYRCNMGTQRVLNFKVNYACNILNVVYRNKNKEANRHRRWWKMLLSFFKIITKPKRMILCTTSIKFWWEGQWTLLHPHTINTVDNRFEYLISSSCPRIKMYRRKFP